MPEVEYRALEEVRLGFDDCAREIGCEDLRRCQSEHSVEQPGEVRRVVEPGRVSGLGEAPAGQGERGRCLHPVPRMKGTHGHAELVSESVLEEGRRHPQSRGDDGRIRARLVRSTEEPRDVRDASIDLGRARVEVEGIPEQVRPERGLPRCDRFADRST